MNNQSALTESVSKNNDQKQIKAKQIFLGIDAHLKSNQVAWRATLRLAHTSSRYRFNNVCRPPMVSVKLPKSVLVVFHLWRATKLPNFFQVKSRAGCSL
jgi:hypothetical protein